MNDVKKSPGRPRKFAAETPVQVKQVVVEEEQFSTSTVLDRLALGVAKNAANKWCVYSFKFNPETKEVYCSEVKEEFSKVGATHRFKKMAIDFLK